ncbi:YcaO-like family protein [Pseudobdellovibrio exovorus]|uniref:YcaO domain-containing protein n=1 Tax=Pseudobdellovibrio exovorus JSS TaxID=1184267 RepID=M4V7E2_9BACT|nr:YcaO-like family protein [Pseudobdellovibrio exovorus]AGH95123.1 hypothetical protein A11Q_907 [Pseudobdellovibrio exovorus JSS]
MELQKKLNTSIYNLTKRNVLKVSKIIWPQDFHNLIYDYHVDLSIDSFKTTGRGTATNADKALQIAFAEAYERLIILENNIPSSNGCAVFTDILTAQEKALCELQERDFFLLNYHGGFLKSFRCFDLEEPFDRFHRKENISCRIFQNDLANKVFSLCFLQLESMCFIGMGLHISKYQAALTSHIEAFRQLLYFKNRRISTPTTIDQFSQIKKYSYNEHGNLLFDPKFSDFFKNFIFQFSGKWVYEDTSSTTSFVEYKSHVLKDIPLVFVRASNPNMLDLYRGFPDIDKIYKRLKISSSLLNSINTFPHPIR